MENKSQQQQDSSQSQQQQQNQAILQRFPDPPAYWQNFVNGPEDMKPPDLKLLCTNKNYSLSYFKLENIPLEFVDQDLDQYGIKCHTNFQTKDVKYEMQLLMQKIQFQFQDYINFIASDEMAAHDLPDQEVGRLAFEKSTEIKEYIINAAHFLNRLRRKQAMIKLKQEMEEAIEKREQNIKQMEKQIKDSIEIFKECNIEEDSQFDQQ